MIGAAAFWRNFMAFKISVPFILPTFKKQRVMLVINTHHVFGQE
jgi:hypothetical protein